MNSRSIIGLLLVNALASAAFIAAHAQWLAPRPAKFALLDVGELYRLKETQVAALLVKREAGDDERLAALTRAAAFGEELNRLIEALPAQCGCLVLARGAVVGDARTLPDLTPELRRRLGL